MTDSTSVVTAGNIVTLSGSDITRFWSYVDKDTSSGCWLWVGGLFDNGYGKFCSGGKNMRAHRVSWQLNGNVIPDGMQVCHDCPAGDDRKCVNPAHLWLGTGIQNMQDMVDKGRQAAGDRHGSKTHPESIPTGDRSGPRKHPERMPRGDDHHSRRTPEVMARGERCAQSKLSNTAVSEMRRLRQLGNLSFLKIAKQYGVSKNVARLAINGVTWAHVN